MQFDPEMAEIRFGCGLSPKVAAPQSVTEMLRGLSGPDRAAKTFPIERFESFLLRSQKAQAYRAQKRKNKNTALGEEANQAYRKLLRKTREDRAGWLSQMLLRRIWSKDGFRERLTFFWGDHFYAQGRPQINKLATSPYVESAIRPNITGKFEDMLIAAITHPVMLTYLEQHKSVGPNSTFSSKKKDRRGLNENLAREVLELHTLGVNGPYSQRDVRQLAELFTGLSVSVRKGTGYNPNRAEPGTETILGNTYGAKGTGMRDIHTVLRDLARHPATARHIATKLAQHFVGDTPDPALINALEQRYVDTDGQLLDVYEALLEHPSSWQKTGGGNAKQPIAFVASAMRALAVSPQLLHAAKPKDIFRRIMTPLRVMGQDWENPLGPDGWAEADTHWLTPQGMAARLQWSLVTPALMRPDLPDPRDFVHHALGKAPPPNVSFAAAAAENRWEGIALILTSPAFQRH